MESNSSNNCFIVKVCVVGASGVGKSSIALRFAKDTFCPNMFPTLGAGFLKRSIRSKKGELYKFQIWDTAGQERFKSLVPLYYHGAAVVLIVYDVTNRDSFTSGAAHWIRELRHVGPSDALHVLVGNKADLAENFREVSEEEGLRFAEKTGALYCETSAKSGQHIADLFKRICTRLEESNKLLPCVPHRPDSCSSTDGEKTAANWFNNLSQHFSLKNSPFATKSLKVRLIGDDSIDEPCCLV